MDVDRNDGGQVAPFSSRGEFAQQLGVCIGRARRTLDLFDPDFALFNLGGVELDKTLRAFLHGGGRLRLAMHRTTTWSAIVRALSGCCATSATRWNAASPAGRCAS
jgi:hypothetical protein